MYEKLTRLIPAIDSATVYGEWVADHKHKGTPDDPRRFPYVRYAWEVIELMGEVGGFVRDHPEYEVNDHEEAWDYQNMLMDLYDARSGDEGDDGSDDEDEIVDVGRLSGRDVIVLLDIAVQAERFCEGDMLSFLKSGVIGELLHRLEEIDDQAMEER